MLAVNTLEPKDLSMIRWKPTLHSFVLPGMAVLAVVLGCARHGQPSNTSSGTKTTNHLCKHQYALCTSAPCIPQPGDPTKAICSCDVEEGPSLSTAPCSSLEPSTDANGVRTIYSAFSQKQFEQGKKGMTCPSGTPWTWCLDKRCTVDPANPQKSICICDVMRTGDWMTLGGNCDTATCNTAYWSGAPFAGFENANAFMTHELNLERSPAQWCQKE